MSTRALICGLCLATLVCALVGCNSIMNGWLDPTQLGGFNGNRTLEIRTSLTIEDTPPGITGATYPTKADQKVHAIEYPLSAGDQLQIEIFELRARGIPYIFQAEVSPTGTVNVPTIGRISVTGLTARELESEIAQLLKDRRVLLQPEVMVVPLFLNKSTFSIFGIGASAASNSPLRAGSFPLRKPDTTILEAINQVGGLNEFVTDVYLFRTDYPEPLGTEPEALDTSEEEPDQSDPTGVPSSDTEPSDAESPETVSNAPDPSDPDQPVETPSDTSAIEPDSAEAELMDAADPKPEASTQAQQREIPEDLQADPSQPWIWLNDEFVPNPAFKPTPDMVQETPSEPETVFEGPQINWDRIAGESTRRIIRIPAEALRTGDPEFNIPLRPGDTIRIMSGEIGLYYVMGQTQRPGPYSFNSEEITLKRAIAVAGGLSPLAWPDRCTIYRRIGQREQMIQVNLDRIFAGKDADFIIRRGDIINVGTHPVAPFLQRIRAWTLPTPSSNVGYSFSYSRNFADVDSYGSKANPENRVRRFPNLFP